MSDGQARVADSISHYDVLQSSGQLTQLRQTVARMMQMNASCTAMIEQFRADVLKELAEEKQAAAMCLLGTASMVGTPTCRWRRRT